MAKVVSQGARSASSRHGTVLYRIKSIFLSRSNSDFNSLKLLSVLWETNSPVWRPIYFFVIKVTIVTESCSYDVWVIDVHNLYVDVLNVKMCWVIKFIDSVNISNLTIKAVNDFKKEQPPACFVLYRNRFDVGIWAFLAPLSWARTLPVRATWGGGHEGPDLHLMPFARKFRRLFYLSEFPFNFFLKRLLYFFYRYKRSCPWLASHKKSISMTKH